MGIFSSRAERAEEAYRRVGGSVDYKQRGARLLRAAKLGHLQAQYEYGLWLRGHWKKEKQLEEIDWYEKAAAQGYDKALTAAIQWYTANKMPERAEAWAQKAVSLGCGQAVHEWECRKTPEGRYQLGLEKAEARDKKTALDEMQRAADAGHAGAMVWLGRYYEQEAARAKRRHDEDGAKKAIEKALSLFEEAGKKGSVEGMYCHGLLSRREGGHYDGLFRAAKAGFIPAQVVLIYAAGGERDGKLDGWPAPPLPAPHWTTEKQYYYGDGTPEGMRFRLAWCREGAEYGAAEAQLMLGRMLLAGEGADADPVAAFGWVQKAAEQGFTDAQLELAQMYVAGQGCEKDPEASMEWNKKALQNQPLHPDLRGLLENETDPQKVKAVAGWLWFVAGEVILANAANALLLLKQAVDEGCVWPTAMLALAALYRSGVPGTPPSPEEAQHWFARWQAAVRPGDTVWFGSYPQTPERWGGPGIPVWHRHSMWAPVKWIVLENGPQGVRLLADVGLEYTSGEERQDLLWRLFSLFEEELVREQPHLLTREEFEHYIVAERRASHTVSASLYARAGNTSSHGLNYRMKDGSLEISGKGVVPGSFVEGAEEYKEEWEEKKHWMRWLTAQTSPWWLADGRIGIIDEPAGAQNEAVLRPAVWLGIPPLPPKDE